MKTAIQFSGGKDSVCVLHMHRGQPDTTAYFADTGASFPHMLTYIKKTCALYEIPLKIVKPEKDVNVYTSEQGLPADIVPTDALPELEFLFKTPGPALQPYLRCCAMMIFDPLSNAMVEDGIELILRGSKWSDPRVGVGPGGDSLGIRIEHPIWNWTDAQVMEYIAENDIKLPVQYSEGCNHSLDCWLCTGHLAYGGKERIEFTRNHYPTLGKILDLRLRKVSDTIKRHQAKIEGVLP